MRSHESGCGAAPGQTSRFEDALPSRAYGTRACSPPVHKAVRALRPVSRSLTVDASGSAYPSFPLPPGSAQLSLLASWLWLPVPQPSLSQQPLSSPTATIPALSSPAQPQLHPGRGITELVFKLMFELMFSNLDAALLCIAAVYCHASTVQVLAHTCFGEYALLFSPECCPARAAVVLHRIMCVARAPPQLTLVPKQLDARK